MADNRPGRRGFLVAFLLMAALLIAIAVLLPPAVRSALDDIFLPSDSMVFNLSVPVEGEGSGGQSQLHLSVVALDELHQRLTFLVSGQQWCRPQCDASTQIVFFAFRDNETRSAGMPPSASVTLPPTTGLVSQSIELPVRGSPTRYPFDTYDMTLGAAVVRVAPDGTQTSLPAVEAMNNLFLTIQEQLPREVMAMPTPVNPKVFLAKDTIYQYALVEQLHFERPLHTQVLGVLLVLLVAAAAAYAVFMRPLHELVINAGGLVLGVWGIRSILTPGSVNFLTGIDLALAVVILFLLGAITVRALQYCYGRAGLPRPPFRRPTPPPNSPPATST